MLRCRVPSLLLGLASIAPALPAGAIPSGVTVDVAVFDAITIADTGLSDSGQIVYRWGGVGFTSGISGWTPGGGPMSFAVKGQPAAGVPGQVYSDFGFEAFSNYGQFVSNEAGYVAIRGAVGGVGNSTGSNNVLWGPGAGGALAMLGRYGQPLPGDSSGGVLGVETSGLPSVPPSLSISGLTVDDTGRTLFGARFQTGPGGVTTSNDSVLYRTDGAGSGSILAREGDLVPGAAPGTTYTGSFGGIESHAGIAFRASTTTGSGIFAEDGGGFAPRVLAGAAAPGTSGVFGTFGNARIDADGGLTFQSALQSGVGGVTSANDFGFWGPNGLIAREGSQAPGAPAGALFSTFGSVDFDDAGIAFRAALRVGPGGITGANDTGLWRPDDDGSVILLTREGDPVPGLPGVTFGDFATAVVATNGKGETAFAATLTGGGVTASNDRALFFADSEGLLRMLLREDEFFPLQGTLRELAVEPGGLNENGQILVRAGFQQGSSVISGLLLVTVPEPSTGLLLGLGVAWLGARRRRGRGLTPAGA